MTESLLEFPAEVTVKAMGLSSDSFAQTVETLVRQHLEPGADCQVREVQSSKGKYTSVSVTFVARDQAHLEGVYASLNTCPDIVFKL